MFHYMSVYVTIYQYMLLYVSTCQYMSVYFSTSVHINICLIISVSVYFRICQYMLVYVSMSLYFRLSVNFSVFQYMSVYVQYSVYKRRFLGTRFSTHSCVWKKKKKIEKHSFFFTREKFSVNFKNYNDSMKSLVISIAQGSCLNIALAITLIRDIC